MTTAGGGVAGVTSVVFTYTIAAKGNLVFCYGSNAAPSGISDTNGNTWIPVPGSGGYTVLWYCVANASGSTTITVTYSSAQTYTQVLVTEYTTFSVSGPFEVALVVESGVGVLSFSQSFTTSTDNQLIVVFGNGYGSASNFTTTSGLTMRYNNGTIGGSPSSLYVGDRPATLHGSYTESGTIGTSPYGAEFTYLTLRPPDAPLIGFGGQEPA